MTTSCCGIGHKSRHSCHKSYHYTCTLGKKCFLYFWLEPHEDIVPQPSEAVVVPSTSFWFHDVLQMSSPWDTSQTKGKNSTYSCISHSTFQIQCFLQGARLWCFVMDCTFTLLSPNLYLRTNPCTQNGFQLEQVYGYPRFDTFRNSHRNLMECQFLLTSVLTSCDQWCPDTTVMDALEMYRQIPDGHYHCLPQGNYYYTVVKKL